MLEIALTFIGHPLIWRDVFEKIERYTRATTASLCSIAMYQRAGRTPRYTRIMHTCSSANRTPLRNKRINKNKGCDSLLYSGIGMVLLSASQSPRPRDVHTRDSGFKKRAKWKKDTHTWRHDATSVARDSWMQRLLRFSAKQCSSREG